MNFGKCILVTFILIFTLPQLIFPQTEYDAHTPFLHRYVTDIEISPNFSIDNTLFAVVNKSGIYKSVDGGDTWQSINFGLSSKDIIDIEIFPQLINDNIALMILVNNNEGSDFFYISYDAGLSWEILSGLSYGRVTWDATICVSPNIINDSTIIIFKDWYPKISNDFGKTSTQSSFTFPSTINKAQFSPNYQNDNTIFAATGSSSAGGGLYKSNDNGLTWKLISRELNDSNNESFEAMAVSPNYSSDSTIFTAFVDGFRGTKGILKTKDNGKTWDSYAIGLTNRGISSMVISPDYANDKILFIATAVGVYISTDGGESWSPTNVGLENLNVESMAISPNFTNDHILFVGTHNGLYKSSNQGNSWQNIKNGLPESSVINISNDPYSIDTLPTIATDNENNVHFIWMKTYINTESPDGVATDVMYMKKSGENFEHPIMIEVPNLYYSKDLSLAVDNEGFAHIAFNRCENQLDLNGEIYYTNNQNGDFSLIKIANEGYLPVIELDNLGIVHIAYRNWYSIYYTNNSSGDFCEPISVLSGLVDGPQADMAVDNNGHVHMIGLKDINCKIIYTNNIDGSFCTPIETGFFGSSTAIAIDRNNDLHFVYIDGCTGYNDVYYINNIGGVFGEKIKIGGHCDTPAIVVDDRGVVHVVHDGSNSQIVYTNNRSGSFHEIQLCYPMPHYGIRAGRRYLGVSPNGFIHTVFHARSNNIFSDGLEHDIFYIQFATNGSANHLAYGDLKNSDNSIPENEDISFVAWIKSKPDEILSEISPGCKYDAGFWYIQCANFPSPWQIGDTLMVHFTNTLSGDAAKVSGELTGSIMDYFGEVKLLTSVFCNENNIYNYFLFPNFPNPFNSNTIINYNLAKTSKVNLKIYNLSGQLVKTLINNEQNLGNHYINWNGKNEIGQNVASGIYLYVLRADRFEETKKMLLLR